MKEWGLGANGWGEGYLGGYNIISAFLIEVVMTFLFVFVILGTTSKFGNGANGRAGHRGYPDAYSPRNNSGYGDISKSGTQPWPCLVLGGQSTVTALVFFVAPIVGAVIAALLWKFGFDKENPLSEGTAT